MFSGRPTISANDLVPRDLGDQLLRVERKFLAFDGEKRRSDPPLDVGKRQADRLRPEIDADQPRLCRQDRGEVFEGQGTG